MNDDAFSSLATIDDHVDTPPPLRAPGPQNAATGAALKLALALLDRGQVVLDERELRRLRHDRLLSQQDLADECWNRNIRVSIATIKRAEAGRAVRFRIARELSRCFNVPVERLLSARCRDI
jgi:DNA-binding XRE family transcriptional regulator